MDKDWDAVARAIQARLEELDMTQAELAQRAGVSPMTVREIQRNLRPRRRSPRTLATLSEALEWPRDHLANVLDGRTGAPSRDDRVLRALDDVHAELREIRTRLAAVEQKVATDPGHR